MTKNSNLTSHLIVLTTIVSCLLGLSSCGEKTGGGGTSNPLVGEPIILDSVLCINVDGSRPVGITDTFLTDEKAIYIWMYWQNVKGRHIVKVSWFQPGAEQPFFEEERSFNSSRGEQIVWFFIRQPAGGFEKGEWSLDISLDGVFERSHLFFVE